MTTENKAIEALQQVALEGIKEQRRARRWGIFFKLIFLAYFIVLGVLFIGGGVTSDANKLVKSDKITAVVDIKGVIMDGGDASAALVISSLRKAFEHEKTKGVILSINSPGGSPVQAGQINDEIKRLKAQYPNIPVYAVVADTCASGGYYIAVAADKIYADKASLVGSIGVRMDSFGFVDAMKTLGVERRLMTAGENKGMLDPFLPVNAEQAQHVENMLSTIHQQFIDVVKAGRGERLADNPDIFSGLFWTGETAKKLGLVDELGDEYYVAKEVIGAEDLVNFTAEKSVLERLSERVGASLSQVLLNMSTEKVILR